MSTIVQGTLKAWLPDHSYLRPDQLHTEAALNQLVFAAHDMKSSGWTYVGDAEISVTVILTPDELIASKVETLKAQADKIKADAFVEVSRIEDKIQQLLAITYTSTEEAA
jgi:hypothetical protein